MLLHQQGDEDKDDAPSNPNQQFHQNTSKGANSKIENVGELNI